MATSQGMLAAALTLAVVSISRASSPTPPVTSMAKPGCQDHCGSISIIFPFGTREGCYLDSVFMVRCDNSFSPPRLLLGGNINVKKISLKGHLHVLQLIAHDCYDSKGKPVANNKPSFQLPNFPISHTRNKFTAIGCDTSATIGGSEGKYATGCMSKCDSIGYVFNGTCSGVGCCQTSIPKGVSYFGVNVSSFNNHRDVWKFNPCSYAFVVEEREFNFSSDYLRDFHNTHELPAVLDWSVGSEKCHEAEKNLTSYACKAGNSKCHDAESDHGYICKCQDGYQGNPYLPNGCIDINECANSTLHNCDKVCINTDGGYTCRCPRWYHGAGLKDGNGCIADRWLVLSIVASAAIIVTILLLSSSWLYWMLKKRKLMKLKEIFFHQNGGLLLQQELSKREGSSETIKNLTLEELKRATNNYDQSRIIGQGGFGTVYKGILADNRTVAIKKSKIVDQSQIEQFINEVFVLSQINHRNVVKLLGCCLEAEVPLLVYEFITNGTLSDHIHDRSNASAISWETRLRIAAETAGVLSYLHSAASIPIIHRDVKSVNILLDDNLTAKVSDFGASRLVPLDQHQLSTMVQGTLGYLDPEYLHTSQLTEKSDVYSFRVVLVELLTGKKALSFDRPEKERCLAMYFVSSLEEDSLFQVLEDHLVHGASASQLKEVAELARRCLNLKGDERPTMKEVALELEEMRMEVRHPCANFELKSKEI